jgi:type IV pilus assembly protein PilA
MNSAMRNVTHAQQRNHALLPQTGFSLIELLIVVAIILIIAAIAIPSLMRSRMAANEAAAAETIRTLTTASVIYYSTYENGYPPTLASLGGGVVATCNQADLMDPVVTTPPNQKSGFTYQYTGEDGNATQAAGCAAPGFNGYLVAAIPTNLGVTGQRSFCSDTPGVLHFDPTGLAPATVAACDALAALQ